MTEHRVRSRSMRALQRLLLLSVTVLATTMGISQQTQNSADASDPVLRPNPMEELRKFEPPADEEYRLGRGDGITVDFVGHPEMKLDTVVGPDGRITLPLAGEVMLTGQTRAEAAQAIEAALSGYYANLTAQVVVTRYVSNRVLVLGAVEHPGMVTFDGTPTLLEALTRSGLMTPGAKAAQLPERCAIYRGTDKVLWVELREMLSTGNAMAGIRLRRDDVVYVPDLSEQFVSVMGEVQHPGAIAVTHSATLVTVVAQAGGLTERAGANPMIQVIDPKSGKTRQIRFRDLLNPAKGQEILPKPGEIVYVPRSGFNRATYVLERLNPLLSLLTVAAYTGAL